VIEAIAVFGGSAVALLSTALTVKRYVKTRADEVAQLIAMGEGMGIEYVPGEAIGGACGYRERVIEERNLRARRESARRARSS
jgi:hypothetical protein